MSPNHPLIRVLHFQEELMPTLRLISPRVPLGMPAHLMHRPLFPIPRWPQLLALLAMAPPERLQ